MVLSIYNLLIKQEKLEDVVISYENFLKELNNEISLSDKKLSEIDNKGTFKSDDEVGFFFTYIKNIQSKLNQFKIEL
jgi:hypothetical protein